MDNEIYRGLLMSMRVYLGSPDFLDSGTGARFKSSIRGKVTIYHENIAAGNQAEVAFDGVSMARRFGFSIDDFRERIRQLNLLTGRPVNENSQYGWPRVGVSSQEHVEIILNAMREWNAGDDL